MNRREFLAAIPVGAAGLVIGSGDALAELLPEAFDALGVADPASLLTDPLEPTGEAPALRQEDAGAAAPVASEPQAAQAPAPESATAPAPWRLFAPLQRGDEVGLGWRLAGLSPVRHGAAVITLTRGARTARVHLCARSGRSRGIAATRHFDLVLMNDGDGGLATDERLGRVVKTLGAYVARAERRRRQRATALRGMLAHDARVARYADIAGPLA